MAWGKKAVSRCASQMTSARCVCWRVRVRGGRRDSCVISLPDHVRMKFVLGFCLFFDATQATRRLVGGSLSSEEFYVSEKLR